MHENKDSDCFQEKADRIAKECLYQYTSLPKNGKPEPGKEWTVLAGIVEENSLEGSLDVVAIGTGTKCIGQSKMRKDGRILHDSHGEVIARRSFLKYLYSQLETAYSSRESSIFLVDDMTGKCSLKKEMLFHFYISHMPCGDASIIPLSRSEKSEDEERIGMKRRHEAEDKLIATKIKKISDNNDALITAKDSDLIDVLRTGGKPVSGEVQDPRGSGCNYHVTGALRNKPGRGDATISMSCSDKIAKWNAVGCLGGLLSHFVSNPIYFQSIVVGRCSYSSESLHRALYGRLSQLKLTPPYKVHLPIFAQSCLDFSHRCQKNLTIPCGSSIAWCKIPLDSLGVSANGFRLGVTRKKWGTVQSQCSICKNSLFASFLKVKGMKDKNIPFSNLLQGEKCVTYRDYKDAAYAYQSAWKKLREHAFSNWLLHDRDIDNFTIKEVE